MKLLKIFLSYLLAPLLTLSIFAIIFQIWKIDFSLPTFNYSNDGLFYLFVIKNIIDTGWFINNPNIGLPHFSEIFNLYDFPLQSDLFQILIIKFFAFFSSNPFLIANCFFIASFFLIALTSFIALRSFKISIFISTIISILYAFLPYHFSRSTGHLFLSNYMTVPLAVMVALWISSNKISLTGLNKKNQYNLSANKFFVMAAAISVFVAINNVYYAYYSCVIFIFAWLLHGLKKEKFFDQNAVVILALCGIIFAVLCNLYLPTLLYQLQNGFNPNVAGRTANQSEDFALRIINLILPVDNHYIDYFSRLRIFFESEVSAEAERGAESLGIIASTGFLFLLLWLVGKNFEQENSFIKKTVEKFSLKKNERNLISDLAAMNIMSVLFATTGGLVMLISLPFPMLRSHARFCVFIAFIALFVIGIIFDKIIENKIFGKKIFAQITIFLVMILAVFDQVGKVPAGSIQVAEIKNKFISDREFIARIENSLAPQAMIFILPVYAFPEVYKDNYKSLVAYLHSKNLRWSYPAISGRESSIWQQKVIALDFKEMIASLKKAGFTGVYLDREHYFETFGSGKLLEMEKNLKSVATNPALVSQNLQLVFFEI